MVLNVAVIDDSADSIEALLSALNRYCQESGVECNVRKCNSPIKFLSEYKPDYDIIFLDIKMPTMNGMDLAKYIRKMDSNVSIIFVTNMVNYAINGYEVAADAFIVKPIQYGSFKIKMDRVVKKQSKIKNIPYVSVYENGVVKYVPISEIRYVQVVKHNIIYHLTDVVSEKRGSMKNELESFIENGFAQCHKSYLVNLRFVLGINGYVLHVAKKRGGLEYEEIAIGHPRKKEFMQALNKFIEEQ